MAGSQRIYSGTALAGGLVDCIAPNGDGSAKAAELLSVFGQWDPVVMRAMKEAVVAADTLDSRADSIATENRLFGEPVVEMRRRFKKVQKQ